MGCYNKVNSYVTDNIFPFDCLFSSVNTSLNDTWLGLRRRTEDQKWEWLDQSKYEWQNWQGHKKGPIYRCARILLPSGKWSSMDIRCRVNMTYVCKKSTYGACKFKTSNK